MVDRAARRQLALLLRRYASGRIDQWQVEAATWPGPSEDLAVEWIGEAFARQVDDFPDARPMHPYCCDREKRDALARWVLFLLSDEEYRWPELRGWAFRESAVNLALLGVVVVAWIILALGLESTIQPFMDVSPQPGYMLWMAAFLCPYFVLIVAAPWLMRYRAKKFAEAHGGDVALWPFHDADQYARVAARHPFASVSPVE